MLERVVLNLQRNGFVQPYVCATRDALPQNRHALVRFADNKPDIGLPQDAAYLLIADADAVYHPQLPARLRAAAEKSGRSQVFLGADGRRIALIDLTSHPEARSMAPNELAELRQNSSLTALADDEMFLLGIDDREAKRRAEHALLRTNWRPHDGIIARLLNKYVSVAISRRIVDSGITPNQMTTVAFIVALAGIGLAAWGSYWSFFWGALLLQIQSVLDGCDGELARMRYQSSDFGAWYDTIVDDVIGILWVSALGVGAFRQSGDLAWLLVGLSAGTLYFVSTGLVFLTLLRCGAKSHAEFVWWFEEGADPANNYPDLTKISTWGKYAIRRDFYVFLFWLLSLVGLLKTALCLAAAGALGWFIVTMLQLTLRGMRIYRGDQQAA